MDKGKSLMDKILYCPGPSSTYNSHILYTQESDRVMLQKQKDIIELCGKYNLPLHIKVHPSGEKDNFAHFKYLTRNYKNTKVIGGYWKWLNKAEKLIPGYQLVVVDIIRTALIPAVLQTQIPSIIYTKRLDLIKKHRLSGLKSLLHVVSQKKELEKLFLKFQLRELFLPKDQDLLNKWFKKRETIQNWYNIGLKDMVLRRKFRHEWQSGRVQHVDVKKLWQRIERMNKPPK